MAKNLPPADTPDSSAIKVGIDDGHAEVKLASEDGTRIKFHSRVRRGHELSAGLSIDSAAPNNAYETDGMAFQVDDRVDGEGTQFDEYPFSSINRVLVNHALRSAGHGGKDVEIVTGLPFGQFYIGGAINHELIARKRKSLMSAVTAKDGLPLAHVTYAHVLPEGLAAYIDFCFDEEGNPRNIADGPSAVVDVGGATTDTVVVLAGFTVDHTRSGTLSFGVLDMIRDLMTTLRQRFNVRKISEPAAAEAIRTSTIKMWGEAQDVSAEVEEARRNVSELLRQEVSRKIGDGSDLEHVIFVGGGAEVFPALAAKFANARRQEKPQFANASGMMKYLKYVKA